jgi:hypothetical protein
VGLRVFNNALNQNLVIDQQPAKLPSPEGGGPGEATKSLFNFDEIARNVLKFVGGVVKNGQSKGLDDEAMTSLFDQARSGVLKGIAMAEKDLGGIMNDEIKTGITRSRDAIAQGLQKLQGEIWGTAVSVRAPQVQKIQTSQQASYQRNDSAELTIRTLDGDEVNIRFENLDGFEINRKVLVEAKEPRIYQQPVERPSPGATQGRTQADSTPTTDQTSPIQNDNALQPKDLAGKKVQQQQTNAEMFVKQSYQHFESSAFSFSVKGDLNQTEVAAIGKLVSDANSLADEFFNGDVESAFNQALEFGFDEQELTGFALHLTRVEQSQSIQTYESVSHFDEDDPRGDPVKVVKPVAHYLDKMLDVIEQSRQTLQSGEDYDNLINGLINQMGEVHTPDLITAMQRFHSFNQRLLDGLPMNLSKQESA